jgi:hypothetical protein
MFFGCSGHNTVEYPTEKTVVVKHCKCPTFDRKLRIEVLDYNDTYGLVSWGDVEEIQNFLKAKKRFNDFVLELNKENEDGELK